MGSAQGQSVLGGGWRCGQSEHERGDGGQQTHPLPSARGLWLALQDAVNVFGVIADVFLPSIAVSCSLESRCALFFSGVPGQAALSLATLMRWPTVTAQAGLE